MIDQSGEKIPGAANEPVCPPADIVELQLLFPTRLAVALESAARGQGLSMGQMVRRLVCDFLAEAGERSGGRP